MSRDDPVEIEVAFVRTTENAVLVEYDEIETWLPRSLVQFDGQLDNCERGELIEINVPEWLAAERGLI